MDRLRRDSLRPPRLRVVDGIPRFVGVEVPLPASPPDDPVAQALDFLERYRELYRLESPRAQLYLKRIFTDATGEHVFFGQHQGGVPVYPADIAVHLSKGVVWQTSGRHVPRLPDLPAPRLGPGAARVIAAGAAPGTDVRPIGEVRLTYFNNGLLIGRSGETRLAWRVYLRGVAASDGVGTTWMYFVDAHDGGVLLGVDESPRAFLLSIRNVDNQTPADGECFGDDVEEWFTEEGATAGYLREHPGGDADADAAYLAAGRTYDFYLALGCDSYDGEGRERIRAFVHYGPPDLGQGAWSAACQELYFADGLDFDFAFGHEFTHAVITKSSGLGSSGDPRALGESYGHIFGSLVTDRFDAIDDPDVDHMDQYDPPVEGVDDLSKDYRNSGIPSQAADLIIEGGRHRGFIIPGLDPAHDREKARRLLYDTMISLTPSADLPEASSATVETARAYAHEGAYGFTDADVCWVRNAFAAVGLEGSADRDCDGIPDADDPFADADGDGVRDDLDNCFADANPGQENADGSTQGDVCDSDDDNDGIKDDDDESGTIGDEPCRGGETVDCDDNCRTVSNADQADADNDGIGEQCDDDDGDGVANASDNCPDDCNPDQADTDNDTLGGHVGGDVCDPDDDADHIPDDGDGLGLVGDHPCSGGNTVNCDDNCRVYWNPGQEDDDGDGVGDGCDNCPSASNSGRRSVPGCPRSCINCDPDPEVLQGDSDEDGFGDACDPDDDDDAICDQGGPLPDGTAGTPPGGCEPGPSGRDDCPLVYDPQQIDRDHNGIGLRCDADEAFLLSGDWLADLEWLLAFRDAEQAMEIPIFPCSDIGCPDWLSENYETQVDVSLPFEAAVNVIDDRGFVVSRGRVGRDHRLAFRPGADSFYRAAGGDAQASAEGGFISLPSEVRPGTSSMLASGAHTEVRHPRVGSAPADAGGGLAADDVYHGARYFLAISPPPAVEIGREYPIRIAVRSGERPECPGDCSGSAGVSINELVKLVNVALSDESVTTCSAGDRDFNRHITVDELVAAVRSAQEGCPLSIGGRFQVSAARHRWR